MQRNGFYRYKELGSEKQEIRLLRIHNPSDFQHSPFLNHTSTSRLLATPPLAQSTILCSLEYVSLENDPPYLALSYCWGDPAPVYSILLDGIPFFVGKNLFVALEHLQHGKTGLPIWIDALCINQEDDIEKSWQVQQMRTIYQKAQLVIIWLGPANDNSELAITMLQKLGEEASPFELGTRGPHQRSPAHLMTVLGYEAGKEAIVRLIMDSIASLMKRPWWQRMWVIQELASNLNAIFGCGYSKIHAADFFFAIKWLSACKTVAMMYQHEDAILMFFKKALLRLPVDGRPIIIFDIAFKKGMNKTKLIELLHKTRVPIGDRSHVFNATDPKDLIFALLGVASDTEELGIKPDYTQSWKDVFTATTVALLKQEYFSILSLCQTLGRVAELPSWVPDWSGNIGNPLQATLNYYLASGSCKSRLKFDESRPHLVSISAAVVESVRHVGVVRPGVQQYLNSPAEGYRAMCSWHLDCIQEFSSMLTDVPVHPYATSEELDNAICRTLVTDLELNEKFELRKAGESSRQAYQILKTSPYQGDRGIGSAEATSQRVDRYFTQLTERLSTRRLFVLKNGFLGLGPGDLAEGDIVVVVLGAPTPYVLRKKGDVFLLVGEVYVHGVMYGEWITDKPITEFTLC